MKVKLHKNLEKGNVNNVMRRSRTTRLHQKSKKEMQTNIAFKKSHVMRYNEILTASSIVDRHPCMDETPNLSLSSSPSSEAFSVFGVLRYTPIFNWFHRSKL